MTFEEKALAFMSDLKELLIKHGVEIYLHEEYDGVHFGESAYSYDVAIDFPYKDNDSESGEIHFHSFAHDDDIKGEQVTYKKFP